MYSGTQRNVKITEGMGEGGENEKQRKTEKERKRGKDEAKRKERRKGENKQYKVK